MIRFTSRCDLLLVLARVEVYPFHGSVKTGEENLHVHSVRLLPAASASRTSLLNTSNHRRGNDNVDMVIMSRHDLRHASQPTMQPQSATACPTTRTTPFT